MTRLLVLALLSLGLVAVPPAAPATAGEVVKMRLHRAVKQLPVARETRRGYDRDKFRHWVDADGDCRDTRDEVLADESLTAVSGCDVQQGRWRSYYDGVVVRDSSAFDEVVHVVQVRRFGGEDGFACEYGVGYLAGGGELPASIRRPTAYHRNPLEAEAYRYEAQFQDAAGRARPELIPRP